MPWFDISGERYGISKPDDWRPAVNSEARKTLSKALSSKRTFGLYDFGDSWHHHIKAGKHYPALPILRCRIASTVPMRAHLKAWVVGQLTRSFWKRWPNRIIQSMR
ncbi:IS1096 element passenger TnpR family protein [Pseudomonas coronafaciens]|uniref:IS1096 element passenger TnpR family protein n=1 Tax=Pseudomonas syringae group TaxID=136849 RepID=UPI0037098A5A